MCHKSPGIIFQNYTKRKQVIHILGPSPGNKRPLNNPEPELAMRFKNLNGFNCLKFPAGCIGRFQGTFFELFNCECDRTADPCHNHNFFFREDPESLGSDFTR